MDEAAQADSPDHFSDLFSLVLSCPALAADEGDSSRARFLPEPIFGGQVYLYEAGQANAEILLLIHGIGDNAGRSWGSVLPQLAQRYHVVVPDLPGFGRSSDGNHLYSPDAYAAFLDWLISALPKKPIHLVGHSLGGGIALVYAAQNHHPLERLVLVDAVGLLHYLAVSQNFVQRMALDRFLIPPLSGPLGRVTDFLLEKTSRLPFDPDFLLSTAFLRQKFLAAEPARIAALALVQTDYSLLLGQIDVPTWLIWGEQDDIAPLRIAKILEWRLPRVALLTMPGGHVPMETDSVAFSAFLARTLTGLPAEKKRRKAVSGRTGRCQGGSGQVFSGDYKEIQVQSCQNVLLKDVRVQKLVVRDSSVKVESSVLGVINLAPPSR